MANNFYFIAFKNTVVKQILWNEKVTYIKNFSSLNFKITWSNRTGKTNTLI